MFLKKIKYLSNSIGFKLFICFMFIISLIIILIYTLQIVLLPNFYRHQTFKRVINTTQKVIKPFSDYIYLKNTESLYNIQQLALKNNLCVYAFNKSAKQVMALSSTDFYCYLDYLVAPISVADSGDESVQMKQYINLLDKQNQNNYFFTVKPNNHIIRQLFYGQKVIVNNQEYYLFVNTPYELIQPTVDVLKNQITLISLLAFGIGFLLIIFLTDLVIKPIKKLSTTAKLLGQGKFGIHFKSDSYNELNLLANSLNFASKEIARVDRLRKELLANLSHDLKTPLASISAYAQLISELDDSSNELLHENCQIIINEVSYIDTLIDDMMLLSKLETSNARLNIVNFDLIKLVEEVIKLFKQHSLNFDIVYDKDQKYIVSCDRNQLRLVIMNYISNAVKHVGSDLYIGIRIEFLNQNGNDILISVVDHGDGIEDNEIDNIWQRYYKTDRTLTRNINGSGLGLAICKAICERCDFKYGLNCIKGKETTFYVIVPGID